MPRPESCAAPFGAQREGASTGSQKRPALVAVAVAGAGAGCMLPLYGLPSQAATALAGLAHMVALLVASVLMARLANAGDREMRRSRWLFCASMSASACGALIGVVYVTVTGAIPVPSLVDAVTPLWVPLAAWGFWLVPTREGERRSLGRLTADGAVAGSALLLISWLLVIEPLRRSTHWTPLSEAVLMLYPVTDVIIAATVLSLLPRARADLRPFLNCVAFGLVLIAAGDSGFVMMLGERGVLSFGWPDVAVQAGLSMLIFACVIRTTPVFAQRPVSSHLDWALPFTPVLGAIAVSLHHVAVVGQVELAECVLAAVMIVAILVRQLTYTLELARVAEEHRYAAGHDELTGLTNRKAFIARVAEHTRTPGAPAAALLVTDLDGFKEVNDTLGHDAGDQVLIQFSAALLGCAPDGFVARLGGDEFAVLLPLPDAARAAAVATELAELRVTMSGIDVSCAVGVAPVQPQDTPADVMRRADLAMYEAKRLPRPRMAHYTSVMSDQAERRSILIGQLPEAIGRGEMRLVYQPLFRLADGTLAGAEALLRWTHPLFGVVPPDEFIPLAEESGHISDIGKWVIDTAVAQVATWERDGLCLPRLFVNAAASQFTDDLADDVAAILERHGVPPARLTLEITETQLPGLAVNSSMRRLRESGVHVALDDFGSGYSSLAQIARLPVDVLKIDRDFIRNLDVHSGRPVMDAIVALARALGLSTVAEGIEDMGQAAEVGNAGVDYAQGYLFSRPLPPHELAPSLLSLPSARTSSDQPAKIGAA